MKVSFAWMRAIAPDLKGSPEEVAERLAALGFPVEERIDLADGLGDIVVGRVEEAGPHPNADRLSLCRVFDGTDTVDVVCGAPNVKAGALYPFAPVGAVLPGGMKIGKAKIRGTVSNGMLCSAKELGLGEDHDGILQLSGDLEPGSGFVDALSLADVRMDVEITANRGDLLSHLGVAREAAYPHTGSLGVPEFPVADSSAINVPTFDLSSVERQGEAGGFSVSIDAPDLCPRYIGLLLRGVEVGPSPEWLRQRLQAAGSRSINNVVDATNYVLLELGQPMHAFDSDRIRGRRVGVRRAHAGERLRTLDGVDRALDSEMLVIVDEGGPIALAGVMGGEESEVSESTTSIFLECALFDPRSVRATRKALGMNTDASYRYERGVDPEGLERALRRAAELIVRIAGGRVEGPAVDVNPGPYLRQVVTLRTMRIRQVLGIDLDSEQVGNLLEPLGFGVSTVDSGFEVSVPGYRSYDVTREADVIEELARTYGYDRFPSDAHPFRIGTVPDHPLFQLEDRLRTELSAWGAFEVHVPAFAPEAEGEVVVRNPVSTQDGKLRSRLLPGVLRRIEYNLARGSEDVRLFELGTVFAASAPGSLPVETPCLAVAVTGARAPIHWSRGRESLDAWDLKALAERIVRRVVPEGGRVVPHVDEESEVSGPIPYGFVPLFDLVDGRGDRIGAAGSIDRDAIETPAWAGPVWALEVCLPAEPEEADDAEFEAPPPYPPVERDLALLVPEGRMAGELGDAISGLGGSLLTSLTLFDVYEGEGVEAGSRSIGYRMRFHSEERTLTDEEVDRSVARILRGLKENFNVEPRS